MKDNFVAPLAIIDSPLWTVDEVSTYLRLNPETVRMMARKGKLPACKVGHVWRFEIKKIQEIITNHILDGGNY
jgi:excisionase family DNA binding protein